jgi:hypothetical protein
MRRAAGPRPRSLAAGALSSSHHARPAAASSRRRPAPRRHRPDQLVADDGDPVLGVIERGEQGSQLLGGEDGTGHNADLRKQTVFPRRRSRLRLVDERHVASQLEREAAAAARRQPVQRLVEAQLAVGELRPRPGCVRAQQLPEDLRGEASNQVLAVDEDALVARVVGDLQPARCGAGRQRTAGIRWLPGRGIGGRLRVRGTGCSGSPSSGGSAARPRQDAWARTSADRTGRRRCRRCRPVRIPPAGR